MNKLKPELLRDIQQNADMQRDGGASVVIDYNLPTVAVELANGDTFFFQDEEASDLPAQIEGIDPKMEPADMILWMALGW